MAAKVEFLKIEIGGGEVNMIPLLESLSDENISRISTEPKNQFYEKAWVNAEQLAQCVPSTKII